MAVQIPPKRCFDLLVPVHPDGRLVQRCRKREAEPRSSHLGISDQADVAASSFKSNHRLLANFKSAPRLSAAQCGREADLPAW